MGVLKFYQGLLVSLMLLQDLQRHTVVYSTEIRVGSVQMQVLTNVTGPRGRSMVLQLLLLLLLLQM